MSEPAPAVEPSAAGPPDEVPKFDETKTHESIDIGFTVDAGGGISSASDFLGAVSGGAFGSRHPPVST